MVVFGLWVRCPRTFMVSQILNFQHRLSIRLEAWSISGISLASQMRPGFVILGLNLCLDGLAQLTSNEYLVIAGTLHGIHAITSRLSPTGSSSGAHVIEAETFKMTIFLTVTGMCNICTSIKLVSYRRLCRNQVRLADILG